jgi:hypothetical protein
MSIEYATIVAWHCLVWCPHTSYKTTISGRATAQIQYSPEIPLEDSSHVLFHHGFAMVHWVQYCRYPRKGGFPRESRPAAVRAIVPAECSHQAKQQNPSSRERTPFINSGLASLNSLGGLYSIASICFCFLIQIHFFWSCRPKGFILQYNSALDLNCVGQLPAGWVWSWHAFSVQEGDNNCFLVPLYLCS